MARPVRRRIRPSETVPGIATLPASAILVGQQGTYVFVIKQDLTVESRVVEIDRTVDGIAFVAVV